LNNDIRRVETGLDTALPWWRTLDPVRQRVRAHMGFNLGLHRLLGFNHALRWMQQGQYDQAATAMLLSRWAKQVGPRAARLAHMMCSGHT
jgi:lysozyme